jgi:threonine dehydrogenase-like Zn-dependent dehydrogenase
MNSYVDQFLKLKCAGDVLNVCNPINKAEKEISESMAIIKKVRNVVIANPMKYTLVDMCCGAHGLTGVLAAHLLPLKKVIAVDIGPQRRRFENVQRYEYRQMNIMDPMQTIAMEVHIGADAQIILTATHCCGELAKRIIHLYQSASNYQRLVLMPCCKGGMPVKVPEVIRDKIGPYLAWSWSLAQMANGKLTVDENIISPCNALITAQR